MPDQIKRRVISIAIYLTPIFAAYLYTKSIRYFCITAGIMSILLGITVGLVPDIIGLEKKSRVSCYSLFIMGIMAILISS